MKLDDKTLQQKKLRQQMVEYLDEQRAKPGNSENWTPGRTRDHRVAEMARAKIGSASYETKGARKWRKTKEHLQMKSKRHEPITEED